MAELFAPRVSPNDARVRWGALWFLMLMAALWIDTSVASALLAAVAGAAGWQAATAAGTDRVFSAAVAVGVTGAAIFDVRLMGVTVLTAAAGSLLVSVLGTRARHGAMTRCGALIGAWLLPGLAAGSVIIAAEHELGAAVILLWAVAMYDAGTYLVGSGARSRFSGLLAGVVGALAVIFTAVQLAVPPIEPESAWRFGILLAVTLPLGPAASRYLGGDGWAVRRLDALVVAGPAWAWAVGLVVN